MSTNYLRQSINLSNLFFDNAGMLERVRAEIVDLIITAWHDKSAVSHKIIADLLKEKAQSGNPVEQKIETFKKDFSECDTSFTPNISIASLMVSLNNYYPLSGTTAYQKLKKISFSK